MIAQLLGFIALAIGLLSYQFKSQRRLFGLNIVTDMIWITHYILLGAWPVVFAVSISVCRTSAGVFIWPKYRLGIAILAFLTIFVYTLIFPPDNPFGWLVVLTGAFYSATVAFHKSYGISRLLMLLGSLTWILIGWGYGSIGEIITSCLSAGSICLAAWRHCQAMD